MVAAILHPVRLAMHRCGVEAGKACFRTTGDIRLNNYDCSVIDMASSTSSVFNMNE